jgi:MYXO-CTERM domain-containing protein
MVRLSLLALSLCALPARLASGEVYWSAPALIQADGGRYSSLEAAPDGTLHLAFLDHVNGDLRYGVRSPGGQWTFETVDTEGDTGWFASLEMDSAGVPHVAYCEFWNYKLKYAVRQGPDDWAIETVDSAPGRGWYSSLALDSAGNPHIAYSGNQEWDLRQAWYAPGAGWQFETIDSAGGVGLYCLLALDSADLCRICYFDKDNKRLKFAWQQPGGGWSFDVVDDPGDAGIDTTIDLDDAGHPHVAYWDRGSDALKYAWHDGADWHVETVEAGTDCGYEACIVWEDGPHISYKGTLGARYAEKVAGVWAFSQVSLPGERCGDTALAIEAGRPRMTWLNLDDGGLYYAEDSVIPGSQTGDFNMDGEVNVLDVDALFGAIREGGTDLWYDLTADGMVDGGDTDELIRQILATEYGDGNLDGSVDGLDYNNWSLHYQASGVGWGEGDFNGDTVPDGLDYNVWSMYYQPGEAAGAPVPEPAALALFAAGACPLLRRRRQA